jgi:hypothetical protein
LRVLDGMAELRARCYVYCILDTTTIIFWT